jgi:hypothetical protein
MLPAQLHQHTQLRELLAVQHHLLCFQLLLAARQGTMRCVVDTASCKKTPPSLLPRIMICPMPAAVLGTDSRPSTPQNDDIGTQTYHM